MAENEAQEKDRLLQLYQAFGVLNQVLTIAEIETIKAAVFEELGLTVPTSETPVENVSPLLLIGDTDGQEV